MSLSEMFPKRSTMDKYRQSLMSPLVVNYKGAMAEKMLLSNCTLITARDNGEDSSGRHKLRGEEPTELVERICQIADAFGDAIEARGWLKAYSDLEPMTKEQEKEEEL